MMKWLLGDKKTSEAQKAREETMKKALASSEALAAAAKGTTNLAQDVTETLQARLDDYSQQIDQTARLLGDALMLVDAKGIVESFNPAAEKMFGWKKRQIIGQSIGLLFQFPKDSLIDEAFMTNLISKVNADDELAAVHYEEFMGLCQDGTQIFIDIGASKITRSDKKTYYIMLVRNVTHRVNNHRMTKELALRNQELLTTIDASQTGFMILAPAGSDYTITFANAGIAKILSSKKHEIAKMNLRDLFGVSASFEAIQLILESKAAGRHEFQFDTGSSQTSWFEVHITPVRKSGVTSQWIMVFYDITELKKAYRDLHKSEAHFKAFSVASSESMLIHNYKSLLDWNERVVDLTGYSDAELAAMNPFDLLHPLQRESAMMSQQFGEPGRYETLFLTKDGDVREVAVNSRPIEWDNDPARIAIVRDITEFKDVETMLKASRERYKTVIDNTIDMIVCFNANLEITFSNKTFRDYFDVDLEDISGFDLLEIIPEANRDSFREYMLKPRSGEEIRRGIHRIQRHDEIRWQDWIDRGIFDDKGNLIEIQSVARDITHLISNPKG